MSIQHLRAWPGIVMVLWFFGWSSPAMGQGLSLLGIGTGQTVPPGSTTPVAASREAAQGPGTMVRGFNQAWLRHHYGTTWLGDHDAAEWNRLFGLTRAAGGRVVRVWLFEGFANAGIDWVRAVSAPDPASPSAVDPRVLAHLDEVLTLAERHGLQLYVTLFTANVAEPGPEHTGEAGVKQKHRWWNLIHDKFDAGKHVRAQVLAPVLEVLRRHESTVFGIDLVNEINAWVRYWWVKDGWSTVAAFVRDWRAQIRATSRIPVTASLGHHAAMAELLARSLPSDAVDFYDVHLYSDSGEIPSPARVRLLRQRTGKPLVLGEFGQGSEVVDDALQERVTLSYARSAAQAGFAAAFAWRLSDLAGSARTLKTLSFERSDGTLRPAYRAFTIP